MLSNWFFKWSFVDALISPFFLKGVSTLSSINNPLYPFLGSKINKSGVENPNFCIFLFLPACVDVNFKLAIVSDKYKTSGY